MKFGWSNFYRSNFPGNFPLLEINQGVVKGMPLHSRVSLEIIFKKLIKPRSIELETKNTIRCNIEEFVPGFRTRCLSMISSCRNLFSILTEGIWIGWVGVDS